jgi:site-specific recombinase XerD
MERPLIPAQEIGWDMAVDGFILLHKGQQCSKKTLSYYQDRLGDFAQHSGNPKTLGEITENQVAQYLTDMGDDERRGLSVATCRTSHIALKCFFTWACRRHYLESSPMQHMKAPRLDDKGKPFMPESDFQKLLDLCPPVTLMSTRNHAILMTFWHTGIRRAELLGMLRTDVDFKQGQIRVFGKRRKERFVPLFPPLKKALWQWLTYRVSDQEPHLWITQDGRPLTIDALNDHMARQIQRAGLHVEDRNHIFRRTFIMRQLRAGVPVKYLQQIVGHDDISTLMGYVKRLDKEQSLDQTKIKYTY